MKNFGKRLEWATRIMKMYFADPDYCVERNNAFIFMTELFCSRTLKLVLWEMNKTMFEHGWPMVFSEETHSGDDDEIIKPRFIRVKWLEIWDDITPDRQTMNCITNQVLKDNVPFDDLSKVSLDGVDVDLLRRETEDGFGIENEQLNIDIKVEAVKYAWTDDDDEAFLPEEVPCLWCYTGRIGKFRFQGLASTSGLALGKAIKAVYRRAKNANLNDVIEVFNNYKVEWHRYGYCY